MANNFLNLLADFTIFINFLLANFLNLLADFTKNTDFTNDFIKSVIKLLIGQKQTNAIAEIPLPKSRYPRCYKKIRKETFF